MAVRLRSSIGFLVVYVAAMVLGRVFTLESTGLALFWPAAGVATWWLVRDCGRPQLMFDAVLLFVVTTAWIAAREGPDGTGTTIIFTLPRTEARAEVVLPPRMGDAREVAMADTTRVRSERARQADT